MTSKRVWNNDANLYWRTRLKRATRGITVVAAAENREFRPDIEGLRAVAVAMVVIAHAGSAVLKGGFVGVDVFFVLSGFLITSLLLKEYDLAGRVSLAAFYGRRVRRLLPASTLVLVATLLLSARYLGPNRSIHVAGDAQWSTLFASNWRFIQEGTDYLRSRLAPSPLQHFWSLAVEEQFYAVWPVSIALVALVGKGVPLRQKLGFVLCIVIVASLSWSIYQTPRNGTVAYFSPLTRAWELAIGALIAVVNIPILLRLPRRIGQVISPLGLVCILASGLLFDTETQFPGYIVALPVVGTALLIAGGTIAPRAGAEVLLKWRPLQWLGKLSYSLYLWHWPVLTVAQQYAVRRLFPAEATLLCLLSLALSAATYWFVENPVRNSSWLKRRSPLVSIAVGVCLVIAALGVTIAIISVLNEWAIPQPEY